MTTSTLSADVLIVGAGPAGATAALNLAPYHCVLLVESQAEPLQRIGESLAPAARRVLVDMGLWEDFLLQGHAPNHGTLSYWGNDGNPAYLDFLRDLDGAGWHLERMHFESWLRKHAQLRGANLITSARVKGIGATRDGWEARVCGGNGPLLVHAKAVIDATGRGSNIARNFGATRHRGDKLICTWLYGTDRRIASELSHVEAEENGWWYSAPLPNRRRVLAFHSDADLDVSKVARRTGWLPEKASHLPGLRDVLETTQFMPNCDVRFTAAHSSVTDPPSGQGWLAVGDASLAFDPLSAQGLFHSLYTGLLGAEACHRGLNGDSNAWAGYANEISLIATAYRKHLQQWYGAERRWAHAPFWQRRKNIVD